MINNTFKHMSIMKLFNLDSVGVDRLVFQF